MSVTLETFVTVAVALWPTETVDRTVVETVVGTDTVEYWVTVALLLAKAVLVTVS